MDSPNYMSDQASAVLPATPQASEGPFYPTEISLDHDNDLVRVEMKVREDGGKVLRLSGTVLDVDALPVVGARVEIWQCGVNGVYRHPDDPRREAFDPAFQGFGTAITDAKGSFAFRTIVPVSYPGRAPHIHAKVIIAERVALVTQYYLPNHPENDDDFVFARMSREERKLVMMPVTSQGLGNDLHWRSEITAVLEL